MPLALYFSVSFTFLPSCTFPLYPSHPSFCLFLFSSRLHLHRYPSSLLISLSVCQLISLPLSLLSLSWPSLSFFFF
ncbi:MAG: hypothetical protein J3Q66DRAFT_351852, partial [Benniella sp.]